MPLPNPQPPSAEFRTYREKALEKMSKLRTKDRARTGTLKQADLLGVVEDLRQMVHCLVQERQIDSGVHTDADKYDPGSA